MDFLTDRFLVSADRFDGPVLVTGAGGCIGAWTVAILSRSGISCIAADLQGDRTRPSLVMGESAASALSWENLDVTDGTRVAEVVESHGVQAISNRPA